MGYLRALVLIIRVFQIMNNQLIKANVHRIVYYNKLSIRLGPSSSLFAVGIDTNGEQNWVFNLESNYSSPTMKTLSDTVEMAIDNRTYRGISVEESMCFEEYPDKNLLMSFNLMQNENHRVFRAIRGVISFPFKFSNESSSVIHQMKRKGFIDYLAFTFSRNEHRAQVFFGGISPNHTQGRHHSYCDVIGKSAKWECILSGVLVKNKSKEIDFRNDLNSSNAYFNAMSHIIFVPSAFFNVLIERYYTDAIETRICKVRDTGEGRYLSCFEEYLYQMGNITFFLGGFAYEMELQSFFICSEEFCHYLIHENPYSNDWVLGSAFYDPYNTMFDYEDKKVHFYSVDKLSKAPYVIEHPLTTNGLFDLKWLFVRFFNVLNAIGVIFLLLIKISFIQTKDVK